MLVVKPLNVARMLRCKYQELGKCSYKLKPVVV